jgi:hydrogenase maturation protease
VPRVRVIACGNPEAGDDAAGLLAIRGARPELEALPGVEVVEAGPALRVLDLLEGVGAVLVVDAVRSTGRARRPGDLVRFEAGPHGLPAEARSSLSSHGLGLAEAIGLAGALGRVPRLVFLGVEAGDTTAGRPLSAAVARAIPDLQALAAVEVARLLEEAPA